RARASAPSASHHDVNGSGSRIVPARAAPAYMTAGMPAITNSHQPAGARHTANLRKKRISPTRPWWKSTRTTPAMPGEYTARMKSGFATLISPKRAKTASGKTMTSRAIPHVKPKVIARNCAIGLAISPRLALKSPRVALPDFSRGGGGGGIENGIVAQVLLEGRLNPPERTAESGG